MVELEPQLQQQAALDVRVLQTRVAGHSPDRAEQDRVVARDRVEIGVGERVAGLEEACGSQREARLVEADAAARGRGIQHLLRLGDDLGTDAVTGDDGELHDTCVLHDRMRLRPASVQRAGGLVRASSAASVRRRGTRFGRPPSVSAAMTAATTMSAAPMSAVTPTPASNAWAAASRSACPSGSSSVCDAATAPASVSRAASAAVAGQPGRQHEVRAVERGEDARR